MDAETAAHFDELLLITEHALALAGRSRRKAASDDDDDVKRLIAIGGAAVAALAAQLAAGSITRQQFVDQATALLRGHAQTAAGIGAAQFGGQADPSAVDDLADGQADYLDGFAEDITGGGLSAAQIAARAALYGEVAWSAFMTARRTSAEDAGHDEKMTETQGDDLVCDLCQDNAAAGWIAIDEAYPSGDDGAPFHVGCRCPESFRGAGDDAEDKAPRLVLVKEARCPTCRHLEARGINAGAELNCRKCRRNFVAQPLDNEKTTSLA